MSARIEIVKAYFVLLENFSSDKNEYAKLLHPEMIATIFPNLISPQIKVYKSADVAGGVEAGKVVLNEQHYIIQQTFETPEALIVESKWTGTMRIDAGKLKKGQSLTAYICFIFEFRDGKIFRQRNYDCYDSF
jgi:ketosteroid isomerase-like protein